MKRYYIFIFLSLFFAKTSVAQLQGSVSFKREKSASLAHVVASDIPKTELSPQKDMDVILAERFKTNRIWDNPRFVKMTYGGLKGMQQSIDKVQEDTLASKNIKDKSEQQKQLDKIKADALVHFDDYSEEAQVVHQKMNENPRKSLLDMTKKLSYADARTLTEERSDYIAKQLEENFVKEQGVSMSEYQNAFVGQLKEQQAIQQTEQKADTFPPRVSKDGLIVEKLDETKALIHLGVKPPKSKK